jgi:hypothetical protein
MIFLYFSVFYRYTSNRRLGGLILWYFFISVCSTDILVTEDWNFLETPEKKKKIKKGPPKFYNQDICRKNLKKKKI